MFPGKTRRGDAKLHYFTFFSSCTIRFFEKISEYVVAILVFKMIYLIALLHQADKAPNDNSYLMILLMPFHRF
jgi:hypothetical protein